MRNTGGTDHQSFDGVGLPGFQFIQDPIEYTGDDFFGTHHTNMDVYDRLQREDLMQAAVVSPRSPTTRRAGRDAAAQAAPAPSRPRPPRKAEPRPRPGGA